MSDCFWLEAISKQIIQTINLSEISNTSENENRKYALSRMIQMMTYCRCFSVNFNHLYLTS